MNFLHHRITFTMFFTLLTAFSGSLWAQSNAFGLAQLMQTLAQTKAGTASFVEKRYVTMLERTLESSGKLSFEAPNTFVRETLKPRRERLAVVGNNVTMSLGARSKTMPLDSAPEAAVIVQAIRGTLTGNQAALEKHFNAAASGSAQRWSLELLPRDARLRELVVAVRVAGTQAEVREVKVLMADGDNSVMTITPDAPGAPGLAKPNHAASGAASSAAN
jgi:hypothetical protein